jgi:hypothetical protein
MRAPTAPIVDAVDAEVVDVVDVVDVVEADADDPDDVLRARTDFLEASRRYLFEMVLPAARQAQWLAAQPQPPRPWFSSRAARRSRAWPVASGPWDRR